MNDPTQQRMPVAQRALVLNARNIYSQAKNDAESCWSPTGEFEEGFLSGLINLIGESMGWTIHFGDDKWIMLADFITGVVDNFTEPVDRPVHSVEDLQNDLRVLREHHKMPTPMGLPEVFGQKAWKPPIGGAPKLQVIDITSKLMEQGDKE